MDASDISGNFPKIELILVNRLSLPVLLSVFFAMVLLHWERSPGVCLIYKGNPLEVKSQCIEISIRYKLEKLNELENCSTIIR